MNDDIGKFIQRFHTSNNIDEVFTSECSYWFATILFRRFIREGAEIMYDKGRHYFGTKIDDKIYDVTGDVTNKYSWASWATTVIDKDTKQNIINNYINF